MKTSFNISITGRLSAVKNMIALALLVTIACTWPLWEANRYYPLFPGNSIFSSVNLFVSYAVPTVLIVCLIMIFLFRSPRFFTGLAALLCISLLVMDTGRSYYWFYFYLVFLLLLAGYNWRVDNAQHYISFYNTIKVMLAGVFILAAVQHLKTDFIHTQWPLFIKPFEKFWTPEQCSYLLKIAYVIPFVELFVAIGLFFNGTKITALCFALLLHVFSFVVLLMQSPQAEIAVLIWHVSMIVLLPIIFAGQPIEQKSRVYAFSFYPVFTLLVFGAVLPCYFISTGKLLQNKIDLMQYNASEQFIYVSDAGKKRLPLYVQSFAGSGEKEYYKLSITRWVMHETNTKQVLGKEHLIQLTTTLNNSYGTESLVAIPTDAERLKALAAK